MDQIKHLHTFVVGCAISLNMQQLHSSVVSVHLNELLQYVKNLENAIRSNRDAKGHNRCWYEREMYKLLPEHKGVDYELPSKEEFLKECEKYYHSCKKQEKEDNDNYRDACDEIMGIF